MKDESVFFYKVVRPIGAVINGLVGAVKAVGLLGWIDLCRNSTAPLARSAPIKIMRALMRSYAQLVS